MRWIPLLSLFILFTACIEISGSEQLEQVSHLIEKTDSLEIHHRSVTIDNLDEIKSWSDTVDIEVRKLFKPVPYVLGKQIASFSQLRADLGPFETSDTIISNGLISIKTRLIHLKNDIENGSGKRAHYNDFILSETTQLDSITILVLKRDSVRNRILTNFNELEPRLESNLNQILHQE